MSQHEDYMPDDGNSGYIHDLGDEMEKGETLQVQRQFTDLRGFYVSRSGHTRLYTASRYGKLYTLKCLKPDFLYTPVYRQALTKEFEIGLQMDHPYICRTIGMEEVEGLGPTIIMEYVDGDTLRTLMDSKSLTAELANRVVSQLVEALAYMHSKQVVHRDLKPSNIMVTHNGHNVKLIDFSLSDSDSFNILKCPAGTSGYIAPEQFLPDAKPDAHADIYSFGMVVKEMATLTGDKSLRRMAMACTRGNVAERPSDITQVLSLAHSGKRSFLLLLVLSCVALALGVYVSMTLYHRATTPVKALGSDSTHVTSDGNQALDYQLWQKVQPDSKLEIR